MMITTANYSKEIRSVNIPDLPDELKRGHDFFEKSYPDAYKKSDPIKRAIDLYLEKLNSFVKSNQTKAPAGKKVKADAPAKKNTPASRKKTTDQQTTLIEKVSDEVNLIKRYASFHNKTKSPEQILSLLAAIQKAILEKRITSKSRYASEIDTIQGQLVKAYNKMSGKSFTFEIEENALEKYRNVGMSEKPMSSIQLLKRYVGMQGKKVLKEKIVRLMNAFQSALDKGKVIETDKYFAPLKKAYNNLKKQAEIKGRDSWVLEISQAELSGLAGLGVVYSYPKKGTRKTRDGNFTDSKNQGRGSHHGGMNGPIKKIARTGKKIAVTTFHVVKEASKGAFRSGKKELQNRKKKA